jgi:hypothetical protein
MLSPSNLHTSALESVDPLDRLAIAYLTLPLGIFLGTWFEWWVALPLLICLGYALKPLVPRSRESTRLPVTSLQIVIAVSAGCAWTLLGGADHVFFANADWHVRDAVLHDLVLCRWPVGYGLFDGQESLLRAPLAFYLPAALLGKVAGLAAAHTALGVWTAVGAALFLLQVLSLTPSRVTVAVAVTALIVLFSGMDIVGSLLNDGPRFRSDWNITTHLEWWAGTYQYSSMTTQLFWVPNHALGGWLVVGLLARHADNPAFDPMLPICVVALALWSPLTAIGIVPFVFWKTVVDAGRGRLMSLLRPRVWVPALAVGVTLAGYLLLDPGRIPKGTTVGAHAGDDVFDLLQQVQFFLFEAGFVGAAILALRRSGDVVVALVFLAILPFASFGPSNDLVMRASIPSLAVLAIAACAALFGDPATGKQGTEPSWRKKTLLGVCLSVGAVTPIEEFARAIILPSWPINGETTLIGANCGGFPAHYVARIGGQAITRLLRTPHRLPVGPLGRTSCNNPALELMWGGTVK